MLSCSPMPRSESFAPPAILIWACTRSTPVTSSVTVCSTCTAAMAAYSSCNCAVGLQNLHCVLHQELLQPHLRGGGTNCRHAQMVRYNVGCRGSHQRHMQTAVLQECQQWCRKACMLSWAAQHNPAGIAGSEAHLSSAHNALQREVARHMLQVVWATFQKQSLLQLAVC